MAKACLRFLFLSLAICAMGCSYLADKNVTQRPEEFFVPLVNTDGTAVTASSEIESLKILQTDDRYPLRIVLFQNGEFYYQVDRLGEGTGNWSYINGGLKLIAKRPIFDVEFFIAAENQSGAGIIIRFVDRFGLNEYELTVRDPVLIKKQGNTPQQLKKFVYSEKEI